MTDFIVTYRRTKPPTTTARPSENTGRGIRGCGRGIRGWERGVMEVNNTMVLMNPTGSDSHGLPRPTTAYQSVDDCSQLYQGIVFGSASME